MILAPKGHAMVFRLSSIVDSGKIAMSTRVKEKLDGRMIEGLDQVCRDWSKLVKSVNRDASYLREFSLKPTVTL